LVRCSVLVQAEIPGSKCTIYQNDKFCCCYSYLLHYINLMIQKLLNNCYRDVLSMPGGQHRAEKVEIWPSPSCAGRGAHLPAIFTSP